MTLRIGKIGVRFHPLLPLLLVCALHVNGASSVLAALLALGAHEAGHWLAARIMRLPIEEIEIAPCGAIIAIHEAEALAPVKAFLLAAGGPVFSLLGCVLAASLYEQGLLGYALAAMLVRNNALLLAVNLLPVLPLDGGRMARAALSRLLPYQRVTRFLTALSYLFGAALCALSFWLAWQKELQFAPALAGLFLIYTATVEKRPGLTRYVSRLIGRREKLASGTVLPVLWLAVSGGTQLRALLPCMRAGRYHRAIVLAEDGMRSLGTLDEAGICEGLLRQSALTAKEALETRERAQ